VNANQSNQGRGAPRRVAVITGASVGIGAAIAARFVADGARVYGLARRPCPVDGAIGVEADLSDISAITALIERLKGELADPVELHLVHNAAVMPQDSVTDLDADEVERALRINLVAPMLLTAGLRPRMAAGSSIIYIGSTLSEKAVPGRATYVASKHAIVGLMRSTTQDLFGAGIHTACVCPGFTDTQMLRPVLDADPALRDAVLKMVSFGRLLDPKEIADVVAFAAATPAINGAVIHANLGQRES
jgi:NAD(P)-dependent dehydrogenase (short-subunit alcohol dehydrogenase family)